MEETSTVETELGLEFWTVPDGVLDETHSIMCVQTAAALRREVRERNGMTIDYMIVERLAFMYAHLRQRESDTENVITDRNRREMLKDWIELATAMKKMWVSEDKENLAENLLKKVDKSVSAVFDELPDTRENRELKRQFAHAFQTNGV